jgi:hypothetical protein
MTTLAQPRDEQHTKPTTGGCVPVLTRRDDVRLRFAAATDASRYLRALTSLLFGASNRVTATLISGTPRGDLNAKEIADRLSRATIEKLFFSLSHGEQPLPLEARSLAPDFCEISIQVTLASTPTESRIWLQCDADVVVPIPTLALPVARDGFSLDAIHALIGLAIRSGGLREAELVGEHRIVWTTAKPSENALPLRGAIRDAVWTTAPEAEGAVVAWVSGRLPAETRRMPDAGWWEHYDLLARRPLDALPELQAHLARQFDVPFSWALSDIKAAPAGAFAVPPEANCIARLVPEAGRVVVAVDFEQPASAIAGVLLHLCAHLALGHVRPGDAWGHWDTAASLSPAPHRQWDREARAYVDAHLARPVRRVTSLAECNPHEKAWLVLLDHIDRMVGQSSTLHSATAHYQAAAYQRQAAQRLVVQLEEYGGAMLCDGVGLGKTYVATTVVVHYANAWREQLGAAGRSASEDPFRITILAPNSVVSTWEREAIPPLAAHGVPLATIRVISHSKLSRIVPSSDILARDRSGKSDMEHLLLSDLVIVDEAHNFRSVGARRTTVLRDLLRLQPRKELRRKVLLLTATPVNNSLEDLRQQAALMFGKPLWFNDNNTAEKYRARVPRDIEERISRAAKSKGSEVAALLIHGNANTPFARALEFRDDIQFGVQVPRVGDYLKEQEKRLVKQQVEVRAAIQSGQPPTEAPARIAGELLDRIVVQRSRARCKQIELEQGSNTRLLFRPDAPRSGKARLRGRLRRHPGRAREFPPPLRDRGAGPEALRRSLSRSTCGPIFVLASATQTRCPRLLGCSAC